MSAANHRPFRASRRAQLAKNKEALTALHVELGERGPARQLQQLLRVRHVLVVARVSRGRERRDVPGLRVRRGHSACLQCEHQRRVSSLLPRCAAGGRLYIICTYSIVYMLAGVRLHKITHILHSIRLDMDRLLLRCARGVRHLYANTKQGRPIVCLQRPPLPACTRRKGKARLRLSV
jgi:hypothetical protein